MDSLVSYVFARCEDVCTLYRVSQNFRCFIKIYYESAHMLILNRKKDSMKSLQNL